MPRIALTIVLAMLTMLGPLGTDLYLPSFHAIAAEFDATPVTLQQTFSLFVAAMSVMMLFHGTLSDSFGRKPVLQVSLGLFALASVGAALAGSIGLLLLARVLEGLCAGAGAVIGRAIVQDKYQGGDAQRMMAAITMVFAVAPAVAPVIGGWLQVTLGWRSVFWVLAGFTVLVMALGRFVLEETLPVERRIPFRPGTIAANYLRVARSPRFMMLVLGLSLVFCGLPLYIGAAPAFVMNILHLPETAFAWLFVPLVAGMVAGSLVSHRLAHAVAPARLLRFGCIVMGVGAVIGVAYNLAFTAAVPYAVLPLVLYSFGLALALPGMTIIIMGMFPDISGLAASMQGFCQMMLFAVVSGVVAPMVFDSALGLALTQMALLALGVVVWELGHRLKAHVELK